MKEYDILIVGGGPGGAMAAKTAAELGLKTIFFERGRQPGEKNSSGCGLGPRMWRDFPEMMKNLTPDVCPSMRPGVYARNYFINKDDVVVGMVMARPTESVKYEPAKSWITMNIYRSDFDPWIANLAVEAGAEQMTSTLIVDLIKENGKVVGVQAESGEKYKAPIVIGADGVISMVAQKSGLRHKWQLHQVTVVPQYDFSIPKENIDKIMGEEALGIWWGSTFPAAYQVFFADGMHIGLGNWLQWWDKNPLYYLNRVVNLKYFQRLMKLLDAKPRELQAHLLPWMAYPENTYTDNVMLIGDAGGFPCPLEAEGIYPAMVTGKLAAEVAAKAISDGDTSKPTLQAYEEGWKKSSIGVEFEAGPELQHIWSKLPFEPKTMEWFVPMMMEILGGIYDWSEPHAVRVRNIIEHVRGYLPRAIPFIMQEVFPLLSKILQEDIDQITSLSKMIPKLLPKKKKGGK
ncbi:MAG: NAD(P)/FAD-dependent oxidoreductase [Candidatus Helarchaeota archaeon]|nr:NAD(P)/FAD-dependent oxidoreductase [Candidatus Helarchaeota archaeon]